MSLFQILTISGTPHPSILRGLYLENWLYNYAIFTTYKCLSIKPPPFYGQVTGLTQIQNLLPGLQHDPVTFSKKSPKISYILDFLEGYICVNPVTRSYVEI